MKKFLFAYLIYYVSFAIPGIIFLLNDFTDPTISYVYRLIGCVILYFVASFPLALASSREFNPPTWTRVSLYLAYFVLEFGMFLLFCGTLLYESFMTNWEVPAETFYNIKDTYAGPIFIFFILNEIATIVVFRKKVNEDWGDWTTFFVVPFALLVCCWLFIRSRAESASYYSESYSSGGGYYASDSSEDYDSSDKDEEEDYDDDDDQVDAYAWGGSDSNEASETHHRPGDWYYDYKGELRAPGDWYYDSKGELRAPDDWYYDGKGELRAPGDWYYDAKGELRAPDEWYYDAKGNLRDPGDDKKRN